VADNAAAASVAALSLPTIDLQLILKITGPAVAVYEVRNGSTAGCRDLITQDCRVFSGFLDEFG